MMMWKAVLVLGGCGLLALVVWVLVSAGMEIGRAAARREMEEEEELPELWAEWDYAMEHEHGGED